MQFGTLPLVNPASVIQYYAKKNLYVELLSKCNSQEFRYIDGFGRGYFLSTTLTTDEGITLTIDERTVDVKVIDVLSLEHPEHPTGLYIYCTAEAKYGFKELIVARNYNVTIDKTLSLTGTPTIQVMEDDYTALTLDEIIQDFIAPFTLVYSASDDIYAFDVPLQGMTAFDAIDMLCAIYGLVWYYDTALDEVVVTSIEITTDTDIIDRINAIQWTQLSQNISDISVAFPLYDYLRQSTGEYWYHTDNTANQGTAICVCDPYFPSVEAIDTTLRNAAALTVRVALLTEHFVNIGFLINFLEKHHYEANEYDGQPLSLSEVYGDWGYGPRSIYRTIPWPYKSPPLPKQAKSRYANNWRGILAYSYYTIVPYFVVTPLVGFDGRIPPEDQRVENIYGWNYGEVGWAIRVEWNPVDAVWEAIQQEYYCPPTLEDTPDYDPPPYEPPYHPPPYTPGGGSE